MFISENNLAALTSTSNATTRNWAEREVYPISFDKNGVRGFQMEDLHDIPEVQAMVNNSWDEEFEVTPLRNYTSIELFAGGGGLALGMEKAGFKHVLLNEFDTAACNTLSVNRPNWNIIEGDVRHIDFTPLRDKVDFLSGGFPCQAFSFAGKQGGFKDIRGTLFFELARAVKEIRPKVFMGENVKGLVSHDDGRTFQTICNVISELGYTLVSPRILKAIMYQVPQKRERIILIAIRNDLAENVTFKWPSPYSRVLTLRDAFYESVIYDTPVPESEGVKYPVKKQKVMELVPQGGDWRNLPEEVAKEYMGGSWLLGGGKTGMARRLSLDEPSLTLTCAPAQKQTERCHPLYTRPLSVREYARIQTFPDNWIFQGTISERYKQIGNAVPVNLAWAIGRALIRLFNDIERIQPQVEPKCDDAIRQIIQSQAGLVTKKDKKTQTSIIEKSYKQLNLFDLFEEFGGSSIVEHDMSCEPLMTYNQQILNIPEDLKSESVLVGLVSRNQEKSFESKNSIIYYTGKRFPATVDLKNLRYFIPYIKGKGVRDVYLVKSIRVGEYKKENKIPEYRMVFDIQYVGQLSDNFRMPTLDIWHTYSQKKLGDLASA
ncbi:MAG: DNA (cytosine-5-)-methyltransferase [Allobaculum sp.]|nr:DNA (cytosine-5-)-methyltransferase [Allobaculum sp.]